MTYITISKDWKQEVRIGLIYSAIFILINLLFPQLTIGFPTQLQSFDSDYLAAGVFAPIAEEMLFRFWLLNIALAFFSPFLAVLMISLLFSIFHFSAYGASLDAQSASFVGAFVFALVVSYIAIKRKSIVIPIVIHAAFNTWLLIRLYYL